MTGSTWRKRFGTAIAGLAVMLGGAIAASPVRAQITLWGQCRMGQCIEIRYDGKTLLYSFGGEWYYEVDYASRLVPMSEEPAGPFDPKSERILCSTTRPTVAMPTDEGGYVVWSLNPGGVPRGFLEETYKMYWVTCHDAAAVDWYGEQLESYARNLGYPLNLEEVREEREVLDFF